MPTLTPDILAKIQGKAPANSGPSADVLAKIKGTGTPSAGPAYGDIFNYVDPNTEGAKATWAKTTTDPGDFHYEQDKDGNQIQVLNQHLAPDASLIPEKYRGMVTGGQAIQGNGMQAGYDYSKIPGGGKLANGKTIDQMYSLGLDRDAGPKMVTKGSEFGGRDQDTLMAKNPGDVSWDPNFGWVTSKSNMTHPIQEKKDWMDYTGMAAGAAAGMFAGPGLAAGLAGLNAVRSIGDANINGGKMNWGNLAMGIAPSLIGMSGVQLPPGLADALRYAGYAGKGYSMYNTLRGGDPYSIALASLGILPKG